MRPPIWHNSQVSVIVFALMICWCSTLSAQEQPSSSAVKHFGYYATDSLLDCIGHVYGKHVARHHGVEESTKTSCPRTRTDVLLLLEKKQIRLFETPQWVYLIPSSLLVPQIGDPYYMKWKRINIVVNAVPDEGVSKAEAERFAKTVLGRARMIPLLTSDEPTAGDELTVTSNITISREKLAPGAPDSIIATIDQLPDFPYYGRLVYGEIHDGQYEVMWDSPLFNGNGRVTLDDVNGDGVYEILFGANTCDSKNCYPELVIFDRSGRELTRQKNCDSSWFSEVEGVSPIMGIDMSIDPDGHGHKEIQVIHWEHDKRDHIFRLKDGVYVPGPPIGGTPVRKRLSSKPHSHRVH